MTLTTRYQSRKVVVKTPVSLMAKRYRLWLWSVSPTTDSPMRSGYARSVPGALMTAFMAIDTLEYTR